MNIQLIIIKKIITNLISSINLLAFLFSPFPLIQVTISGFDLNDFSQCLRKWNTAMQAMDYQCDQLGAGVCLPVYYEQLVLDPRKTLKSILSFLHVPWNDSVLNHEQLVNKPGGISLSKWVAEIHSVCVCFLFHFAFMTVETFWFRTTLTGPDVCVWRNLGVFDFLIKPFTKRSKQKVRVHHTRTQKRTKVFVRVEKKLKKRLRYEKVAPNGNQTNDLNGW